MFFIVNHENSIIAADTDFLEGIGADSIYDAALLIKNGEVVLDELEQSITYFQQSRGFAKVQLSTFLGDAYLYEINEEMEEEEGAEEETVVAPQEEALFNLAMPQADLLQEEVADREDLEATSIMEEHVTPPTTEVEPTEAETATEALDIPEETTEELTQTSQTNFREIAALIGVSEEEYLHFLDDFVKESSQLESSLRSNDLKESREALAILKEASLLLHLPQITEKLNALSHATPDEKSSIVDSYLTLVTQVRSGTVTQTLLGEADTALSPEPTETELSRLETGDDKEEMLAAAGSVSEPLDQVSISLDQVQAIPFDFSINEAADELTLPASLVSEFVVDFINQAKENLPVIQNAYENKDLETIQTTAHMLKGASSNLRIVPMAETLYQLQFNEDIARVPELLAHFTGQLKALTLQMDQA